METLKNYYEVFINWGGTLFCVITIDRDYHKRAAQLSMPRYIEKALHKLQHSKPTKKQNAPYKHTPIQYGAKFQTVEVDQLAPLSPTLIKYVKMSW